MRILNMPRLIPDAIFSKKFQDVEGNAKALRAFIDYGVKDYVVPEITLPEGYSLIQSTKTHTSKLGNPITKIRLICGEEIVYAVDLEIAGDVLPNGKHCTQILVWRIISGKHKAVLFDFATKMFFHFMKEYTVIVSDTEQTQDGRRFWQSRITEAFENNLNVYFTDLNTIDDNLCNIITPIVNEKEFISRWFDHGWGDGEDYKDRLFLISNTRLDLP